MKTISFRIISTAVATMLAAFLVTAFSILGRKSQGPLSHILNGLGDWINKTETNLIIKKREVKRADKLSWLNKYEQNTSLLKHPDRIFWGAFDNQTKDSFESLINLEDSLNTTFPFIHIYSAWGSKPEQKFPKLQVETIVALGSIPVVTWEPWLTDFTTEEFPKIRNATERDKGGLKDIAKGLYDKYIEEWAQEAAALNAPLFLRVGHEMNDPYRYPWGPQNNKATDFILAYRHIHDVFMKAGANNVIWIWSPHPAYGFFKEFYPGNEYVDYVGVSALNYGTVASWSKWWAFDEIFGNYYKQLAEFKKPIMLTELGSLVVGGKRETWFKDALNNLPAKYPLVKSILLFHYSEDKTTTIQTINWYIINDKATLSAIKTEVKKWPKNIKP